MREYMNNSIFITNPTNIRYLIGFVGVERRDAYLLLLSTKAFLFVSSLYTQEAKKMQLNNSFLQKHFPKIQSLDVHILSSDNRITKQLATLCKKESIQNLQYESDDLTVSEYTSFKNALPSLTLIPIQNVIETLRMKKFPHEIASIKKAATITDKCFTYIQTKIKKGVTESQIAWDIETFFRKAGAQLSFSPIVAFGPNSALPHYATVGQGSTLSGNEIILLDFGARVDGYCADMTRMIFVGKPKLEWIKAYDTVLKAQTTAIDLLSHHFHLSINESGVKNKGIEVNGAEIDQICRKILEDAGLPSYPHSVGHGVGLDIHEAPRLTIHQDSVLTTDMVVTVEPATYMAGDFGIRIEDLVYLTNSGISVLSKSTKGIVVLTC